MKNHRKTFWKVKLDLAERVGGCFIIDDLSAAAGTGAAPCSPRPSPSPCSRSRASSSPSSEASCCRGHSSASRGGKKCFKWIWQNIYLVWEFTVIYSSYFTYLVTATAPNLAIWHCLLIFNLNFLSDNCLLFCVENAY